MKKQTIKNLSLTALIILLGRSEAHAFKDVYIDNSYYSAISHYEQLGLIDGYEDGTFKGTQKINRVEAIKMILKAKEVDLNSTETTSLAFNDLIPGSWYMPYLEHAHEQGYISGYPDLTFRPEHQITLAETLSLLYKIHDTPTHIDPSEVWFDAYIKQANEQGLLNAIQQHEPHHQVNREELLTLVYFMDTGLKAEPFLSLKKPYTLQTIEEITYQMGQGNPNSAYLYSQLKAHVEATLFNDHTLPVAIHFQEKALSCEIASLKTVMDYLGQKKDESILFEELTKATPNQYDTENNTWGDPNKGFVGSVDGSQIRKSGYGVYWDPIATLAQSYFPNSKAFSGESLDFLLNQLTQGKPAIIWGHTPAIGGKIDISWETPEGKLIYALNGEHTFTVIGFEGNIKAPTGIVLIDPLMGKIVQSTDQFMSNWATFNHSGVLVEQ